MDKMHTLQHMRATALLPDIAIREMRGTWENNGRQDAHARAMEVCGKILTRDNPAVFSDALDARIRDRFSGLVAGDAEWPSENGQSDGKL